MKNCDLISLTCSSFRALKAKEGKGVDCEAAEAKFSTCHKEAKERSVIQSHLKFFFPLSCQEKELHLVYSENLI